MSPDQVAAEYRRALQQVGTPVEVIIRRYTGTGSSRPKFDTPGCAGRMVGYGPDQVVGTVQQGDRKIILLADDLNGAGLALPITVNDKAVVRGKELQIIAADDSTRRVAGVLIAYELQVRG